MIKPFHYVFPFGKENSEVVYDYHALVSLTDYGTFANNEFYDNNYQVFASIYKNHDPENNIDIFILYFSITHHEVDADPIDKQLTLIFDSIDEAIFFLQPYLTDAKEQLDFINSYHEDFYGKYKSID